MTRLLKFLRSEQRVGEIGKEPGGHDAGEPIIEQHCCLLQSVAGVCVSDGSREEAQAKGKQDEVEHLGAPPATNACGARHSAGRTAAMALRSLKS